MKATMRNDRVRQFWQQSKHPVAIWTKVRYIHDNPVGKGLVWEATPWGFSRVGYWLLDPAGETEVVLTAVRW